MNLSAVYPSGELHEDVESRRLCPPGAQRPSPKILGSMNEPTSTADLLKGDLSRHSSMMAQYPRVTFQAAWRLGIMTQVVPSVPLESPCCLTALDGK